MVVAILGLKLLPYHASCYAQEQQRTGHHFLTGGTPINHGWGNFSAWMSGIVGVTGGGLLLGLGNVGRGVFILLLGAWIPVLRLLCYIWYERPLLQK